jgi:hypothetical protein
MEKKLTMILVCLFLSIGMAFAQTKITGTVVSQDDGEPVIGASVFVQGTKTGTVTNGEGTFSLNVPANKKLIISYVGMETQSVLAKPGMKVVLKPSTSLQEVVVTGMQKMDRRMFTGSTTKINAQDAKIDGLPDISRSLEGACRRCFCSECIGNIRYSS